jgi:transposase
MPGPGATDPADLHAHARAHLGLSRQVEQTRRETPHPSRGGRGYDTWFCWEQLDKAAAGEDVDVSVSTIRRWRERLEPYRATGNKAREQIVGVDLVNLVTFLHAWPESQLEEMAVFLYNEGGPLYSIDVISKCLAELEITKKRASTEAYQAQREDVQFRVWSFWNCPSPLEIFEDPDES